jgi:hypothetical protein
VEGMIDIPAINDVVILNCAALRDLAGRLS